MSEQVKSNKEVLEASDDLNVPVNDAAVPAESTPVTEVHTSHTDHADNQKNSVVDVSSLNTDTYDFNDFNKVLAGEQVEKKVTAAPKTDAVKEVEKLVEEPKKEATAQVKPKDELPKKEFGPRRDYSGFEEEEIKALKHMGGPAFDYVAPKLKQLKEVTKVLAAKDTEIAQLKTGKQMLPENYFEHPQAFVLTKEYNEGISELNKASQVQQHWQSCMAKIRKGEPWKDLDTDKNGNLVYGVEKPATAEAEAEVMAYLQGAVNQVNTFQNKVITIQNNFGTKHKAAVDAIKAEEKKMFGVYDDPNHPMQPTLKSILNMIPVEFRSNPLASITARSATAALQFSNLYNAALAENAELKKGVKPSAAKEEDSAQAKAGPTTGHLNANGGGGGKQASTVGTSIEDFERAMNE
jgi:hypothetical protein